MSAPERGQQMSEEEFQDLLDENNDRWQNRKWKQINDYTWESGNYCIGIDYDLADDQWIASFKSHKPEYGDVDAGSAWNSLQKHIEKTKKNFEQVG